MRAPVATSVCTCGHRGSVCRVLEVLGGAFAAADTAQQSGRAAQNLMWERDGVGAAVAEGMPFKGTLTVAADVLGRPVQLERCTFKGKLALSHWVPPLQVVSPGPRQSVHAGGCRGLQRTRMHMQAVLSQMRPGAAATLPARLPLVSCDRTGMVPQVPVVIRVELDARQPGSNAGSTALRIFSPALATQRHTLARQVRACMLHLQCSGGLLRAMTGAACRSRGSMRAGEWSTLAAAKQRG
jgi:hypothetical protein